MTIYNVDPTVADISDAKLRALMLIIGQIGGFAMFAVGVYLMIAGTNAEGAIDIRTTLVSGTLTTKSAGFFVCVAGLALIATTFILAFRKDRDQNAYARQPSTRDKIQTLVRWLLLASLVCVIGAGVTYNAVPNYFAIGAGVFGVAMFFGVIALLAGDYGGD